MNPNLRAVLMYFFHLAVAILGVAILETGLNRFLPMVDSVHAVVVRTIIMSIVLAALVAVLMRIMLPSRAAGWIWVLPVILRLPFVFLLKNLGWMQALGLRESSNTKLFVVSFTFTVIVVRAVSYSLAAHFALRSRYLASLASGRSGHAAVAK